MKTLKYALVLIVVTGIRAESIVKSFQAPGPNNGYYAYGLAWDGEHLWVGEDLNGTIYEIDTSDGSVITSFPGAPQSNHGLAFDGSYLWASSDYHSDYIFKFDLSGNKIDSILNPAGDYSGGMTFDGQYLWVSMYYPNTQPNLLKVDTANGTVVTSIPSPGLQPQGLAWDGTYLWVSMDDNDGDPERVWKLDPANGDTLLSFPVPTTRPRGLAWDGQYLWLVARGPSGVSGYIYKIDPYATGNPEISLSTTFHSFGNVLVGDTAYFDLQITNTGGAALSIDSCTLSEEVFFLTESFPISIDPGSTYSMTVYFAPDGPGNFTDTLTIYHNAPLQDPQIVALSGVGVYSGPVIHIPESSHDYGTVRVGAQKRWFMEVENQGNSELIIDQLTFSTGFFFTASSLPISVQPNQSVLVDIWFYPQHSGSHIDTLLVHSNDPLNPEVPVYLSGIGDSTPAPAGEVLWSYQALGSFWQHIRSIKSVADLTGDGVDEVVAISENDTLYLFNGNGSGTGDVLWRFVAPPVFPGDRSLIGAPDLNGDGKADVILGTAGADRRVYAISGATGNAFWFYDTHEYGGGGWVYEVSLMPDIDGDGIPEVLAGTGDDGYHTGPNRAYCFSGANGTKLWERPLNAAVFGIRAIGDINGDGISEVACGTGNSVPSSKKVCLLDGATGSLLWTFQEPDAVWAVSPLGDINGDGHPDLVEGIMNGQVKARSGSDGSVLWTTNVGGMVINVEIMDDVNDNGYPEVLPSGTMSSFFLIDGGTGDVIWAQSSGHMAFSLYWIPDLDGDGVSEVIGGSGYSHNHIYVFKGQNGNVLWDKEMSGAVESIYFINSIDLNTSADVLVGTRDGWIKVLSGGPGPTFVEETEMERQFRIEISPNPARNSVILRGIPHDLPVKVALYDASGRKLNELSLRSSGGSLPVELRDFGGRPLPNGVYFVEITGKGIRRTEQISVLR